ncbi:hypothetical protein BH11PSE7_BH11PSE7_06500 [soil metagenome]
MTHDPTRHTLKPCEDAGLASVEEGVVLLDGPDGVAVAMTAEAALLTAENLRRAATEALDRRARDQPPRG